MTRLRNRSNGSERRLRKSRARAREKPPTRPAESVPRPGRDGGREEGRGGISHCEIPRLMRDFPARAASSRTPRDHHFTPREIIRDRHRATISRDSEIPNTEASSSVARHAITAKSTKSVYTGMNLECWLHLSSAALGVFVDF